MNDELSLQGRAKRPTLLFHLVRMDLIPLLKALLYEVFLVKATFVLQLPGVRIERQKLQNRLDLKLTLSDLSMSHVGLSGKFRRRF